jgi:hypothetical protein
MPPVPPLGFGSQTRNPPPSPLHPWERRAVWLILAIFVGVALDTVRLGATYGQDFGTHDFGTRQLLAHPDHWFVNSTSRPLLYWIGGISIQVTHDRHAFRVASVCFILLGAAALGLLHRASFRLIRSPALRVAAIALIAFLPVTVITTVVYASDTLALLPFVATGWSLVAALAATSRTQAIGYYAVTALVLAAGNFCKATFGLLPVAVALVIIVVRLRVRSPRQPPAWLALLACLALPLGVTGWLHVRNSRQLPPVPQLHHFDWHGTGDMTWRSLLGLKRTDARILAAPVYWEEAGPPDHRFYPLLAPHAYSYGALVHLAIFTDLLNFTNPAHRSDLDAPRPPGKVAAASRAVRFGLLFSTLALLAAAAFLAVAITALATRSPELPLALLVWLALSLAWGAPLVLLLPFVRDATLQGYWLPRLTLPAIWIGFLLLFAAADRWLLPARPRAAIILLVAVVIQSGLDIQALIA